MFHASADNLDDLMRKVFTRLLSGHRDNRKVESRKGKSTEVFGALLELSNPRARLGRSQGRGRIFSPLGELLWYLSGTDKLEQISFYISRYGKFSNDQETLNGAYGPRIFSPVRRTGEGDFADEWQRVVELLLVRTGSRNAVIQILTNEDLAIEENLDVPCTCALQFVVRGKKLHLHVHMRSNDAFLGLPHDVFAFTMLQEIAARELGKELGRYTHSVASLHLYDDTGDLRSRTEAQQFIEEGLRDVVAMPVMPHGDPWPGLRQLLKAEAMFRGGRDFALADGCDPYWADLITILRAHAMAKMDHTEDALEVMARQLNFDVYRLYMLDRIDRKKLRQEQMDDLLMAGMKMRQPLHRDRASALIFNLARYEGDHGALPGIVDPVWRQTLVDQMISSLRRIEYITAISDRHVSDDRSKPESPKFDPLKAAVALARHGQIEEAIWTTFVATHFGKHASDGWKLAANVYGSFMNGPIWTAAAFGANPGQFRQMLQNHRTDLENPGMSGRFSNHRQYQSKKPASIARVFETFHQWQFKDGSLDGKVRVIHKKHGQNPTEVFDVLYRSMKSVHGFGRLGIFDFLTMIGKLRLAPIEAKSVYLTGATGPLSGARLLCFGDREAKQPAKRLERLIDGLDDYLQVGKQVLEDSLCNWQKSPDRYVYFVG